MTVRQMADGRAGWWLYGLVAGWVIAMLMAHAAYALAGSCANAESRPTVERPVLPVS